MSRRLEFDHKDEGLIVLRAVNIQAEKDINKAKTLRESFKSVVSGKSFLDILDEVDYRGFQPEDDPGVCQTNCEPERQGQSRPNILSYLQEHELG